jgi:hypothetical protein
MSPATDASFESVGKILDEARQLTKERGAQVVILGAMRRDGVADLALTHTAEFEGRWEARRARVQLAGKVADTSNVVGIESFIDQTILASLEDWADLAVLRLPPPKSEKPINGDLAEREAESVTALAEHDPATRWDAMHKQQTAFWYFALRANTYVARWYERCGAADMSYKYSRLLAGMSVGKVLSESETTKDPGVMLAALQTYLYCDSNFNTPRNTRGREGLNALWPYVKKVAEVTEMANVEPVIEERPWPNSTVEIYFAQYATQVLTKSLLMAVNQSLLNPTDSAVALAAALNFLKADIRAIRRTGVPTEQERQARTECRASFDYSIEQSESWQALVSRKIDPLPSIADLRLPVLSACGPAQ